MFYVSTVTAAGRGTPRAVAGRPSQPSLVRELITSTGRGGGGRRLGSRVPCRPCPVPSLPVGQLGACRRQGSDGRRHPTAGPHGRPGAWMNGTRAWDGPTVTPIGPTVE